jgi:lipoprotein signal peptidase
MKLVFPWGVVLMLLALGAGFALAGLWWWVLFVVGLAFWLGIVEILAVRKTGLTISGQFLAWSRKHPWAAAALAALLGGAIGYLIYHLTTGY